MKEQYATEATKEDFSRAFKNEELLSKLELEQLRLHFQQPGHAATPTFLGKLMGDKSHHGVSARNVGMAKRISRFLEIAPPKREDGSSRWWAYLIHAEKVGPHWKCELKPEVVSALVQLGWTQTPLMSEEELNAELKNEIVKARTDSQDIRRQRLEKAPKRPAVVQVTRAEFRRNGDVVAEVMFNANGVCEDCGCDAPFKRISDGTPYLEIHHVLPLAEGGDDTVENAVALCPNCHRKRHFA